VSCHAERTQSIALLLAMVSHISGDFRFFTGNVLVNLHPPPAEELGEIHNISLLTETTK
jgi:hypothetical protein